MHSHRYNRDLTAEELLRTTPIFSRLGPADRAAVAAAATVRQYPKGETIFEQKSPSDALSAIISA
jgi:signal-transduction protein with cAMP-binding, CBS, and nucleotidyltransferase domain